MDKRKNQIQSKVKEITEEKNLLESYLDNIISQINSCVDLATGSKKLKHKDCTLIFKYELEVLKKITDMIFELECLIDQSPLDHLKTATFEDYSSMTIKPIQSRIENINISTQEPIAPQQLEISSLTCSSVQLEEINSGDTNTDIVAENFLSDIDIQDLRNTLKKYSEKLRSTPDYMPHITDMYQNSLSNSAEYYNEPSTSELTRCRIHSINLGLEKDEVVVNGFDIPEKDTNKTFDSELHEKYPDVLQKVELLPSAENDVSNCSLLQATHDLNLIKSDPDKGNSEEFFNARNGSSSDLSSVITTESCSSRASANGEANRCSTPLVDENNLIVDGIVDEGPDKTEDIVKSDKVAYTAIEKLNNIKIFDRQAEAIAKMEMVNKPDISLKPTEHRIKNNLETNDKKSKKKNKKNKLKESEFFELVPKAAPKVGMNCAFCHIESPNEFYLHIVDDESLVIDGLTEKLNDMFNGTMSDYNSKEQAFNSIGNFCFCFVSSYNSWFRAQIIDWELKSKSEDVVVQCVDYGDRRRISYKNLRRMTKEIANIPMMAVRCHLALMYPPDSTFTERLTTWPAATIDALTELSGIVQQVGEREKIFRVVYANTEGNSMSIDLHNIQDNEEQTVGQILLDLGLAVQIIEEYDEEHAELDMFLQDVDSLETDNINEAVMGYDPRDEVRICRFTKPDGTCYKGKNCKLEHIPLSKDGFTTDKEPIFKEAMYSLMLPARGCYVNILITAYKDVSNFFAQIVWKPRKQYAVNHNLVMDEDLCSLMGDMNQAKTVRSYETFKIAPAIGEIVIVKHWSKKYMRAVVREEIPANDGTFKYQVFTLDFGEEINVTPNLLWKIKPHFLELPFQAVQCYLSNCVARKDCDANKAKTFFLGNLYYHNFAACVLSSCLPLKVTLTTFDGKDVGKMLIEKEFAKETIFDINPAEDICLDLF